MTTEGQVVVEEKSSFLKRPVGGGGKKKAPSAPNASKFGIPPRPQVNLMPPEILEGRHVGVLKRKLLWTIIALVVLLILVYAFAFVTRAQAESRHDDALATADQLTLEKKKYSPVTQVLKAIDDTKDARTFALSTEVNWSNLIYAIQAVLPEGVTVEAVTVTAIAPGDELAAGSDELTQAGIGVINFTAHSDTLPDASAWIDALNTVPGLADTNLQSSTLLDEEGKVMYEVNATVQVTEDALANRTFADEEPADDTTDSGDEG